MMRALSWPSSFKTQAPPFFIHASQAIQNPIFNSENGKITLTKTSFVKSEEAVFQVTFKTKAGVSGKTGNISFTNILASNSEQEIFATDISTTITIGTSSGTENKVNNTVNNAQGVVQIVPTNNTVKNTVNKVNTVKNTSVYANNSVADEIPYTGAEDTVMYIMVVVLALSFIFYVKYQKINRDLK